MTWMTRVLATAGVFLVLVLAWFVWPTPYHYFPFHSGGPTAATTTIRVNRFTGRTAVLTPRGWRDMPPETDPLAARLEQLREQQRSNR